MRKLRLIRQRDAMQCGIASLAMICNYYGRRCTVESLSRLCFATTEGVSLLAVKDAAEAMGLEAEAARVGIDALAQQPLPCILHWNQNHFVVLYKVSRGGRRRR